MAKNALGFEEKPPELPYQTYLLNGSATKGEDPSAPLTAGACVWLWKKVDGQVYVLAQKRALVVHNGGFYDVSAGGHIDLGEDPLTAALRESKEELGLSLSPNDLEFLCAYRVPDKIIYIFLSDRTEKADTLTLNPGEVESVEWISLADFPAFAKTNIKPNLRKEKFHLTLLVDALTQKSQ